MARWLDYFSLFGYSQQINLPKIYKNDKVGLKFCQTLNKLSEVCLRFLKVCPNGEVSPNLVTLETIQNLIESGGVGGVHPGEKRGLDLRGCGV